MAENIFVPTLLVLIFISRMILGKPKPLIAMESSSPPNQTQAIPIITSTLEKLGHRIISLRDDHVALKIASEDYGHMITEIPAAVLFPSNANDIATVVKASNIADVPFGVSARGCGHSVRGQAMSRGGVVVNMTSLKTSAAVTIGGDSASGFYVDVGGEAIWADVLRSTAEIGLAPASWTDYLYLSVGGTLSNAGISGQSFRYGPQIANVREMDVVTGKGDFVTCSPHKNSDLFYAVLGGLGQFGIITRARIVLEKAPKRVKWIRMLYSNFSAFTEDQERLIKINGRYDPDALDYLEGSLLMNQGSPNNWRSSFFPPSDHPKIISQVTQHKIIYCLEVAKNYDEDSKQTIDEAIEKLLLGLKYDPGFRFEKDVLYVDFLDRVRSGEIKLQSQGLWEVPHPWLNLFIPKTRVKDFDEGVFKGIVLKRNITTGPVLFYPMNRNKWDSRTSAVIPDGDVFYTVGFLHSSGFDDFEMFDDQNKEILQFCESVGIEVQQYLPHYQTREEWKKHFGSKWKKFHERKIKFDPKKILSRGQRIFN